MEVILLKQLVVLELLRSHDLWRVAMLLISDWLTGVAAVKLQEGQMILEKLTSRGHLLILKSYKNYINIHVIQTCGCQHHLNF